MKAALLQEIGRLDVADLPAPELPRGGVLVRIEAAAVCRSDIKMVRRGQKDLVLPRILGHEAAGTILASDHPDWRAGTPVALYPGRFCGRCPACRSGRQTRCPELRIFGFNEDGFFRSCVPFPEEALPSLVRRPGGLTARKAALAEPLACCISALGRFADLQRGTALVIGAGAVGSLFAALLLAQGWDRVLVADRNRRRLEQGLPPGVTALHAAADTILSVLQQLSIRLDLVVPACPDGLAWPLWEAMNPGGGVSFFSGMETDARAVIESNRIHYGELTLAGSYGCRLDDFTRALGLIASGKIDLECLKPEGIALDGIAAGMERLEAGVAKKLLITEF
ncbi:MAG: alcohol dehydrogenase catalytic domain-containing protein [Syntrophaceae bacterium]|nr:alcohol dehydrogenase catalytic domain-containing protein [Syntrophaceae bacterium]